MSGSKESIQVVSQNSDVLTLYHKILALNNPQGEAFESIVGKEENAGNQHFLLFQKCFLLFTSQISTFGSH